MNILDVEVSNADENTEIEYCTERAYAEIPHKYQVGDIVKFGETYAVVAEVRNLDELPKYMKYSNEIDMCLYCLRFDKDSIHSCKGAFGHLHFPILLTEICLEEELPEEEKEQILLSRLLKGEIRISDFLLCYSNGDIDSLMKIKGLIK